MANSNGGIVGVDNPPTQIPEIITTFNSSGTLTTAPYTTSVDYLVVAGGGGGGNGNGGDAAGGGGAGGFRTGSSFPVTSATAYPITVGGGGSNASGSNSSIGTSIVSTGGGRGGQALGGAGYSGGSGGGDAGFRNSSIGGSGIAGQGYAGGPGNPQGYASGSGGGPGGLGTAHPNGLYNTISGASVYYGRGGDGYYSPENVLQPVNTGNGGDGRAVTAGYGQLGASGIVILRMGTPNYSGNITGSPSVTSSGGITTLIFTSSGSYTA